MSIATTAAPAGVPSADAQPQPTVATTTAASAPDPTPGTQGTLAERVRADGVEFILALFVDLAGKPCAKLVPAQAVEQLESEGVGFAGYAVGAIGQQPSDPDIKIGRAHV